MSLEMPRLARRHPNRLPFRGVLTVLDAASDKPPAGARGRRVVLTRAAAEAALPSLLGMALDYTPGLDGHDAQRKVGIITSAEVVAGGAGLQACKQMPRPTRALAPEVTSAAKAARIPEVKCRAEALLHPRIAVGGYLYARDFPDVVQRIRAGGRRLLGMSYEVAEAQVRDIRAAVWELTDVVFTGAAVLRRDKAAYRETWIELS